MNQLQLREAAALTNVVIAAKAILSVSIENAHQPLDQGEVVGPSGGQQYRVRHPQRPNWKWKTFQAFPD